MDTSPRNVVKKLSHREMCELEILTSGGFYPLTNYMDKRQYACVLATKKLPTGDVFSMPIVLAIRDELKAGDRVLLRINLDDIVATMIVSECWSADPNEKTQIYFASDTPTESASVANANHYVSGELLIHHEFRLAFNKIWSNEGISNTGFAKPMRSQSLIALHHIAIHHHGIITLDLIDAARTLAAKHNAIVVINPLIGGSQRSIFPVDVLIKTYNAIRGLLPDNVSLEYIPYYTTEHCASEALQHAVLRHNYGYSGMFTHGYSAGDITFLRVFTPEIGNFNRRFILYDSDFTSQWTDDDCWQALVTGKPVNWIHPEILHVLNVWFGKNQNDV